MRLGWNALSIGRRPSGSSAPDATRRQIRKGMTIPKIPIPDAQHAQHAQE